MRKRIFIAPILVGIVFAAPTTAFAADTPSPQSSPSATHSKQTLIQAQKDAISAARAVFAAAKSSAQNGFDRALADAKAIRDQAIAAAGTDLNAVRAAKRSYRDSYKMILHAYKSDLDAAKLVLKNALAAARASK